MGWRAMSSSKNAILVVDTESTERRGIRNHLLSAGHDVAEAANEKEIDEKMSRQPALVLLDILAPGMDGTQICRKLKADDATRDIPVLFLTTDTNPQVLEMIYDAGGADIVEKPVAPQVLLARVATHLALRDRQRRIEKKTRVIDQLNHDKTQLLIDADRLATLSAFSSACAHDINNPVSFIMGNAELAKLTWNLALPIVERHLDEDVSGHLKKTAERMTGKLDCIIEGAERVSGKVREFRLFSQKPNVVKKDCRLVDVVNRAANLITHRLKKGFKLEVDVSRDVKIHGEPQRLSQAFVNLFNNAIDTMAPYLGTVSIGTLRNNGCVNIRVKCDRAPAGPENAPIALTCGWDSKEQGDGNGQGLFVAQRIIEEHNGEMLHVDSPESGAQFDIVLPAAAHNT